MIAPIESMKNAFRLDGKNAVITGGNRGLGLGIALAMAEQGANVAILCRDKQKAAEALEQLKPFGGKYMAFDCDVTSIESVRAAAAKVSSSEALDGLSIVISGNFSISRDAMKELILKICLKKSENLMPSLN